MNRLFRNCTEEVKYYMSVIDVEADQTFIKAGEECKYIYIILSGKVTGVEWPMHEKSYFFKDFGPGDFFGEIECFAGLPRYRISILSSTLIARSACAAETSSSATTAAISSP